MDHNQNMLKLPNGISSVTMTRPGHGQPIRVKLPLTEPNQNWCTIRVDVPNHTVTCPESNLALKVKVLKKTADLAGKEKTTVQGEVKDFGVYAVPGMETYVFVGPFASKKGETFDNDESSVGHCSDPKEFDEDADDSEPSCNPMCPMPCQKHGASKDSDNVLTIEPEPGAGPDANLGEAQRDRVTSLAAGRIRAYLSLLNNPTKAGDYRWGWVTLSRSEIEKRIAHLGTFQ